MRIFILVLFIFLASAGTGVAGDLPSHLAPFGNEGLGGLWVLPLFGKRHRLCFDQNWVHVSAGNAYPTRFVQLVVDPKLLKTPGVQYDIRWSFLAKGCIDVSNVHKVWFVIHGDANFSPKNVDRIDFTLRAAQ